MTEVTTETCEYFMYFARQHPTREVRTCLNPVKHRLYFVKGNKDINLCSQHATRVRSANQAYLAAEQRKRGL